MDLRILIDYKDFMNGKGISLAPVPLRRRTVPVGGLASLFLGQLLRSAEIEVILEACVMRQPHCLVCRFLRLPSRDFLRASAVPSAPPKLAGTTPITAQYPDLLFSGLISPSRGSLLFSSIPVHWDECSSKIHESTSIRTNPQPEMENQGYPMLLGSTNKRERQSAQGV